MSRAIYPVHFAVPGLPCSGQALVCSQRLSFWGGFDPKTGCIVEPRNPLLGKDITGRVVIFPSTKGSSGTSNMLAIAQRAGHAPKAFINREVDAPAALAAVVCNFPLAIVENPDIWASLIQVPQQAQIVLCPEELRIEVEW